MGYDYSGLMTIDMGYGNMHLHKLPSVKIWDMTIEVVCHGQVTWDKWEMAPPFHGRVKTDIYIYNIVYII